MWDVLGRNSAYEILTEELDGMRPLSRVDFRIMLKWIYQK